MNELTVTFKNAVETSGAAITVTKGSDKVSTASETWSADFKSLVIKTTANMINGTYKVTVKTTTEEASGTAEVTSQKVTEIKILNKVALTTAVKDIPGSSPGLDDATGVLVYYDVVDQYGESMRTSTTIDWSSSCHVKSNDKTRGVLVLDRTDDKAFTYGESVYVTGVHAKTGVSVSATLTVGAKQALNSVEVKGFVKKGTSTVLTSLPAGFKSQAYYLVYSVLDQNDNEMVAADYLNGDAEVTFISDNILVLKEISKTNATTLTLDGVEYCAAFVEPGIDVNKGGEVNITAIANKTGNKKSFNVVVGNKQILKSFTMSQPTSVVADGETVEIPFSALDQEGKEIKNFVTLASQSDFNRLQLNASHGTFRLYEKQDGTAGLSWTDGTDGNWNSNSEDGIDRPISLTAVVVGGDTSNEMVYVSDKAMPVAIKSVDMNSVYIQRAEQKISLSSFTFIDQYGREITKSVYSDDNTTNANKGNIYDNGFFGYVNNSGLSGTEFNSYKFGVKAEFKGEADNLENYTASAGYAAITGPAIKHIGIQDTTNYTTGAAFKITSKSAFTVCADQTLKFSVEKFKTSYENVSPIKNLTFKGVNIDRVSGFEIGDLKTFYVKTNLSDKANGIIGGLDKNNIVSASSLGIQGIGTTPNDTAGATNATSTTNPYLQAVKVTGKYNGITVDIPTDYYTVAGNKLGTALVSAEAVSTGAIGQNVIDAVAVTDSALKASDLYDVNSAQYTRKLAEDTLKVTVYKASGSSIVVTNSNIVNTATKKVSISDATPYAAEICANDEYTITPALTAFAGFGAPSSLLTLADQNAYKKAFGSNAAWVVKDQYGVAMNGATFAYKITEVKENAERYAENNFKVTKNDTNDASVLGAECGDTFVLTISATAGGATVTKNIKITVGADTNANITGSANNYVTVLVNTPSIGLEAQRTAALGSN